MLETIIASICSGLVSGCMTLIVLKTDMQWIKRIIGQHDKRLTYLEREKKHA